MYNRNDPRFRRRLNQFTSNLESANESAQVSILTVTQNYLKPCFASLESCFANNCTFCCPGLFPADSEAQRRLRRQRGSAVSFAGGASGAVGARGSRSRVGPEWSFDFYDDWEEDENAALLAWGDDDDDEIEDVAHNTRQPARRRQIGMNYGTGNNTIDDGKIRADGVTNERGYLGFLNSLPRLIAGKGLTNKIVNYQPSAEGLKDRSKGSTSRQHSDSAAEEIIGRRSRSGTVDSTHTHDSHSSRGDLFPSDEEDAVALDDEFDITIDNESASSGQRRQSNTQNYSTQRPLPTRRSSKSQSSNESRKSPKASRKNSKSSSDKSVPKTDPLPTLTDLHHEEQKIQAEEEAEIEQKRDAAQKLAAERGLLAEESSNDAGQIASDAAEAEDANTAKSAVELKDTPSQSDIHKDSTTDRAS